MSNFSTPQEHFWEGKFGTEYIDRNVGEAFVASKLILFSNMLRRAPKISSALELGCNIGLNLEALKRLNVKLALTGVEINEDAVKIATEKNIATILRNTIIEPLPFDQTFDLTFTKTVLIHINPESLVNVYDNLYRLSNRYILVCEYYNPSPVTVSYRGHSDRLFKRDFAGEMIDRHGLRLLDYGFAYHRDNYAPQDDVTWFLLEK
jgi:pseudaminic acid biosynthesis-associated methylase